MNEMHPAHFRTNPRAGGEGIQALPGPDDITRVELSNGITILARPNFNSPSVYFTGFLHAGGLSDPDEKQGLAAFTAAALMRGSQRLDFQSIYNSLESVGASLGFESGTHTTGFGGRALVEDLDLLLELFGETLLQPAFPAEHVERLRAQFLTGLAIRAQDTSEMASLAFDQMLYKGHPYSRSEDGYPETIQAISRQDLFDFHQAHYGPEGLVLVIVGGIEPAAAVEKVSRVLGSWENPNHRLPPVLPPLEPITGPLRRHTSIPGKRQVDVLMGVAGPERRSPDYLAASLANNILGQFGMYGRIGDAVRERAGLAYFAYSSLSGGMGPGPWYINAGVDPENVDRAIALIFEEIALFNQNGPLQEELSDTKANYVGRLPLSLESNSGVAGALLNLERHQLGLDYYRQFAARVAEVGIEDVVNAARRYLQPERMVISTAGTLTAGRRTAG
jgi:zinc protease